MTDRAPFDLERMTQRPWHFVYYLLAALDLVTVLASITLNHRIMQIYVDSVAANQEWERREEYYGRLEQAALAIAAPGNDVFASRDVMGEAARFTAAVSAFDAQLAHEREEVARDVGSTEAALVLYGLDMIEPEIRAMAAEARVLFERFRAGDLAGAGERMAAMDQRAANVHDGFIGLGEKMRTIREDHFRQEIRSAEELKTLAHMIVGLVVLMTIGALWYGVRLYRDCRIADAERARYVEALTRERAKAEAANVAKSRFLATVTHEIRTSLMTLFATLDLMPQPPRDAREPSAVDMARQSAQSMQQLMDRLLDVAKIESGRIEFESVAFDPRCVLEATVGPYAFRARLKGVAVAASVAPDVPLTITGDPLRFAQIVSNLVDNAVKFTRNGSVTVRLALRGPVAGGKAPLSIVVRDTGIGITPEEQTRIFDDFVQADGSTARIFGGTGLGLGIVQGLSALMNGALRVSSTRGVGSEFTVDLDLQAQA